MPDTKIDYLTQESAQGPFLAERLVHGPLGLEEATRYAIELGGAIAKAHSHAMVHGAICPRNIAITAAGLRLLAPAKGADSAPYNSPEQARGEKPDARSDVFSFGAVVYEMVTGNRAFTGPAGEIKRAILSQTPAIPAGIASPALETVIASCLEKDPARRRQRIQTAVIELKLSGGRGSLRAEPVREEEAPRRGTLLRPAASARVFEVPVAEPVPEPKSIPVARPAPAPARPSVAPYAAQGSKLVYANTFRRRVWIVAAAALALAASGIGAVVIFNKRPSPPVLKFAVTQPEHTSYPGMPAVSPDGRYLTFSAVGPEGKRMLWLRPLDALHAIVIPATEGASAPFWSPDSQYIAFFAARNLLRVKITGGSPEKICDADALPGGGAWNRDGTILFTPSLSDGFYRVPASGGKPQPVLKLNDAKNERGDVWPQFLPDGKHFIFYQQTDSVETAGVYVGSLEPLSYHRLFNSQTNAVYSAPAPDAKNGHLLYINERNLTAIQFNTTKLETVGDPVILANDIGAVRSLSLAPISASANGVLVYQGVGQPAKQMVWLDRSGKQIAVSGEPGDYGPPRMAPDGNRGIVAKADPQAKIGHLWLLDRNGAAEQITRGDVHEGSPVWSPDGTRIAYFAQQGTACDLYIRAAVPNSKPELVLKNESKKYPTDWSHDGKHILYGIEGVGTRLDIWGYSLGDRRTAPIVDTVFSEAFGAISPNGKWLAYQSNQGGHGEVYVQAFDGLSSGTKRRWQISKAGGGLPRWRMDGAELFFLTEDGRMMSAAIRQSSDDGIEAGQPQFLFQTRPIPKTWNMYDVSPDGQRFLFNVPLEWTSANPITVVTNWTEKLKEE